jgi:hypothetical protein
MEILHDATHVANELKHAYSQNFQVWKFADKMAGNSFNFISIKIAERRKTKFTLLLNWNTIQESIN